MGAAEFISLDHNATTPPFAEVCTLVAELVAEGGNPSSVHSAGRRARNHIETARRQVAAMVGARPRDVTFFSCATEANNTLLKGFGEPWTFLRPESEHAAVREVRVGQALTLSAGAVDLAALERQLAQTKQPILLAIMAANNETGLVTDLVSIAAIVSAQRAKGATIHYHIDGVQAPGKMQVDFAGWGCDSLALSAHKMGGAQGAGALITRPGFTHIPLLHGGGQERNARGGTENVAAIGGFGLACELSQPADLTPLRNQLEAGLKALNPDALIVAQDQPRLGNTTCLLTPGYRAETLLMQFDLAGVGISSGSACSSGKVGTSHVLAAHGFAPDLAASALRFSLGRETEAAHIQAALKTYANALGVGAL